jgi:Kef-type K+ transport system membrane component KefB
MAAAVMTSQEHQCRSHWSGSAWSIWGCRFHIVGIHVLGYLLLVFSLVPMVFLSSVMSMEQRQFAEFGVVFLLFNIGLEVQDEWFLRFFFLSADISLIFCVCNFVLKG